MKIIIQILIIISLCSCKEVPTYNPFDDQFDVSVKRLVRDKCDTISAGCGYYNLRKNSGKLRSYYQIDSHDFYEVVAKGFNYELDTFDLIRNPNLHKIRIDSILNLPIPQNEMNQEFGQFGYKIISRNRDTLRIVNAAIKDTVVLELDTYSRDRRIIRGIGYFRGKPRQLVDLEGYE